MVKTINGKLQVIFDELRETYGIAIENTNFQDFKDFEGKEVTITIFDVNK